MSTAQKAAGPSSPYSFKQSKSSSRPAEPAAPQVPDHMFAWPEIAAALLESKGIKKGWWRIGIKMRFGALTTRMGDAGEEHKSLPTAIIGIENIAMFATDQGGEMVFDAGNGCVPVPAGAVATGSAGKTPALKAASKKAPASHKSLRRP
ncbi:hypothetical protein [Variovorax guangxiensis]|uniref:hypothetical protein n=1 Tax=Variovorax guangxiensis TaxID=1775474 RepID=UPI00285B76A5|nr:hypothetical protein [Variovorax guangxiensis]MDR6857241.1 hypothetical protein [Variovorax guangxiensis]